MKINCSINTVPQKIKPQKPRINNVSSDIYSKEISFTANVKAVIHEKFAQAILKDILNELKLSHGPTLEVKPLPYNGIWKNTEGKIIINELDCFATPIETAATIRHEVRHFEQSCLVARLPNGIERLWQSFQNDFQNIQESIEKLKNRSIYTDFLPFRRLKKHKALVEDISRPFDYSVFKTFFQKVVDEQGVLNPISREAVAAEEYLKPDNEYPDAYKLFLSIKDFKSIFHCIYEKSKILSSYSLNITELEANDAERHYISDKRDFIVDLYRQVKKECK